MQLAFLVLIARPAAYKTKATIAAGVIGLVGALVQWLLSYIEHTRSQRPSDVLNAYLVLSLLFDIARDRTLWLRHEGLAINAVFTASVCIKCANLLLEATEKTFILKAPYNAYPPEATSSIFSRCFFSWQWPLFRKGFSHTLTVDDLFILDKHLRSEYLQSLFSQAWEKGLYFCHYTQYQ